MELVHECFQPLPIFEMPFFTEEVTGIEMLHQMADTVFGDDPVRGGDGDPTQKFYVGKPQDVFRQDGHYVLSLPLPLVERSEMQLHRSVFDELVVRIGNWKRNVALPIGLAKLDIAGAKYEGDRLNMLFAAQDNRELAPEELKPRRWDALKARLRKGVK